MAILADSGIPVPEIDYRKVLREEDYAEPESIGSYISDIFKRLKKNARMIDQVTDHTRHWRRRAYYFRWEIARREMLAVFRHIAEFTPEEDRDELRPILYSVFVTPPGRMVTTDQIEQWEQEAADEGLIDKRPPSFETVDAWYPDCEYRTQVEEDLRRRYLSLMTVLLKKVVWWV